MDEELIQPDVPTVGERLRAAREEKGLSLEDVAAQTRIPRRHLESIENADWDALPAPTYTTGFAKSYASAVGLDRTEIGDQLRAEMGGQRFAAAAEVYEAADPARTMPKWLVLGGLAAVIVLVLVMTWLNHRSLETPEEAETNAPAPTAAPVKNAQAPQPAAPAPATNPQGQVVLTATDAVWFQVRDKGTTLFSGTLQPGQTWALPATATAPVLKTGKPEALRANIGNAVAPPLGPPATTVSVSLLPADLMKGGKAGPTPQPSPAPAPQPRPVAKKAGPAPAPPPAPAETPPQGAATTNTGE